VQVCSECGEFFPKAVTIEGKRLDLHGRLHCLECKPHRPLRGPRKPVPRPTETKRCENCGSEFQAKQSMGGKTRSLYRRRFCFTCSPFGIHNTSKAPPGTMTAAALVEFRRRRRNAKTYRYQKKQRRSRKAELIDARGGQCERCGYAVTPAALEFHHRDARTKEFQISYGGVSRARLLDEASKCDLLCANCHRLRHLAEPSAGELPTVTLRRERKQRAVKLLGASCLGCGSTFPARLFEFHHLDATTKDFAISADGILRSWPKIEAELAKCVLLCANCHRETHAGLRSFSDDRAIGEPPSEYRVPHCPAA